MKRSRYCFHILVCLFALLHTYAKAQTNKTTPSAPVTQQKFLQLNYDEDYSWLSDKASRTGLWRNLKYIPLIGKSYFTLGGEVRPRLELREHLKYGRGNEDLGYDFQQRSRLWTDVRLLPSFRLFAELKSGTTYGLDYPASPVDYNTIDLHQAFVEYSAHLSEGSKLYVRAGRQEILFGKARLFDVRQPPNNRHSYDAARIGFKNKTWNLGLIAGAEEQDKKGSFDDGTNRNLKFAAAHLSRSLGSALPGSSVELLYIYTDKKASSSQIFIGKRNSLSARVSGVEGGLNYDVEVVGQAGKTAQGYNAQGWYLGTESSYTFRSSWHPHIGARVDIGSGNSDSTSKDNSAYDYLWSRGQSSISDIGYTNVAAAGPSFGIKPNSKLAIDGTCQGLWRLTSEDGIYTLSGASLRKATDGTSNYIGLRCVLKAEYQLNKFLLFGGYINQTFKGTYLKESGSTDMCYANIYSVFRF